MIFSLLPARNFFTCPGLYRLVRFGMGALLVLVLGNAMAVSIARADTLSAAGGAIEITPQVHASVQLEYQGTVIQVDPWGAAGADRFAPADLILVTDNPGHHLDSELIARLSKPGASVVMPANSRERLPRGIVMTIDERLRIAGIDIQAVAAYDIIPGAPAHLRGDALGYVLTLGGKRVFIAGVTECVDEVKALDAIDVAFLPMNIPPARMTPAAAAECARTIDPEIVYTYHYDQGYPRRLADPDAEAPALPDGLSVAETVAAFARALEGSGIEYRRADWYPMPASDQ